MENRNTLIQIEPKEGDFIRYTCPRREVITSIVIKVESDYSPEAPGIKGIIVMSNDLILHPIGERSDFYATNNSHAEDLTIEII